MVLWRVAGCVVLGLTERTRTRIRIRKQAERAGAWLALLLNVGTLGFLVRAYRGLGHIDVT